MALGKLDMTAAAEALKRTYDEEDSRKILYEESPLLAMIKKETKEFEGDSFNFAVQYGTQRGVATNYASAAANQSTNLHKQFRLTRAKLYGKGTIDRETMLAMKSKRGAFVNALESEKDGVLAGMKERIEAFLYGNGGGSIGRVGAITTNTITLVNPESVRFFQQDGVYELSATDGTTGAVRAGTVQCSAVDRDLGIVTFTGNVTAGIAAAVVGDYIFVRGDHSTSYGVKVLTGLAAWLPATKPVPGDSFFAVDRSADPTRLAGLRYNGGGAPMVETIKVALGRWSRENARPDTLIVNPVTLADIELSLGAKVTYETRQASDANIGFDGIKFSVTSGKAALFGDPACPAGVCYALKLDTWRILKLGGFPELIDDDGLPIRRDPNSDGYMFEYGAMGQLACKQPGKNGIITF